MTDVWLDLYFLVNAGMDYLCILLAARMLHRPTGRLRAMAAAILGGIYASVELLIAAKGILPILSEGCVAVLIAVIAFWERGERKLRFLRVPVVFVFLSVMLGGLMTALCAGLNRLDLPLGSVGEEGISVWVFALMSAVSGFLTVRGGKFFGKSRRERTVTVNAVVRGREITLTALVDSGNLLRDPVSGRQVIVASPERMEGVLPFDLSEAFPSPAWERWMATRENAAALRLIPIETAAGDKVLPALIPDRLTVTDEDGTLPADYLIAVGKVGGRWDDFDAVIPTD